MNDNSMAIAVFCSHLGVGEGVEPLTPKEWSLLAGEMMRQTIEPSQLFSYGRQDFSRVLHLGEEATDRMLRLIDRSASLSFEISKYESMGITLITRADEAYPAQLKKKLGNACPPIFYGAGPIELLQNEAVGYVGSRTVGEADIAFTKSTVQKTVARGYAVVSGGAKGSDSIAEEEALAMGGKAIAFLADSMLRKIKNTKTIRGIRQGNLLLLSVAKPDAGFNTGIAMMRNKYIYAQSSGTVVVKADYNKGGTWTGAVENLKKEWALTLCWDNCAYRGNQALIEQGAIPIQESWNGNLNELPQRKKEAEYEQLDLFGGM